MKVTFILKNLSNEFYNGFGDSIVGLNNISDKEKFDKLSRMANGDLRDNVKMKSGNGSFRDRVELNSIIKKPYTCQYEISPRKGYNLVTFDIKPA